MNPDRPKDKAVATKKGLNALEELWINNNQEAIHLIYSDTANIQLSSYQTFIKLLSILTQLYWSSLCIRTFGNDEGDFRSKQIIKSLLPTSFTMLKGLSLLRLQIQSIEPLCRLKIPTLTTLQLSQNNIVSFKTLRKCSFPRLFRLIFAKNKIADLEYINELDCKNLNQVLIEHIKHQNPICHDIRFFFTINTDKNSIHSLFIKSTKRIKNTKLRQKLNSKFPLMTVRDQEFFLNVHF